MKEIREFLRLVLLVAPIAFCHATELTVTELWPPNQSTNVCTDTRLRLTFNEPPAPAGKGKIAVYRTSDKILVDVFDLSDVGFRNNYGGKTLNYDPVRIVGNVASVELHSRALSPGETYYVNIEPGVFKNANGGEFAGFTNDSAWKFSARAALPRGRTNLVVAADGTGDFCTPQGAVDYVSDDNQLPIQIFIRKGVYDGLVYIMPDKAHIRFIGEDRKGTIITGRNNDRLNSGRIARSLVGVDADDFVLENLTLHNTTPYRGSQAEALRINADRCVLRNADFYSFQDTLLLSGRVYATNCYVEGDVDFIWGKGSVFFDRCEIKAVHNGYYLQARNSAERFGYIFNNCKLTASPEVEKCILARIEADRFPYSQVTFINCQMGAHIPPVGWEVKGTNASHLRFEEFRTTDAQGKYLDVKQRHAASRQLTESEAAKLSNPTKVFAREDKWNPQAAPAAIARPAK